MPVIWWAYQQDSLWVKSYIIRIYKCNHRSGPYDSKENACLLIALRSSIVWNNGGNSTVVTKRHILMEVSDCAVMNSCVRSTEQLPSSFLCVISMTIKNVSKEAQVGILIFNSLTHQCCWRLWTTHSCLCCLTCPYQTYGMHPEWRNSKCQHLLSEISNKWLMLSFILCSWVNIFLNTCISVIE